MIASKIDRLFTIREAGELLTKCRSSVYALFATKELTPIRTSARSVAVRASEVQGLIDKWARASRKESTGRDGLRETARVAAAASVASRAAKRAKAGAA